MNKKTNIFIWVWKGKELTAFKRPVILAILFSLTAFNAVKAQTSDYDKAITKFTGEHKYDIERPSALDGVTAPDFSGQTLDGNRFHLADLKGKVVVLNFWFIACAPCRMEVVPLNEVVQQFKGKDVVFMSVAREKEADLVKHLQSTPFSFQVIADPNVAISRDTYHLFGYPTTVIIDKQGKIRYYTLGGKISEEAVRKEMDQKVIPVIEQCLAQTAD